MPGSPGVSRRNVRLPLGRAGRFQFMTSCIADEHSLQLLFEALVRMIFEVPPPPSRV